MKLITVFRFQFDYLADVCAQGRVEVLREDVIHAVCGRAAVTKTPLSLDLAREVLQHSSPDGRQLSDRNVDVVGDGCMRARNQDIYMARGLDCVSVVFAIPIAPLDGFHGSVVRIEGVASNAEENGAAEYEFIHGLLKGVISATPGLICTCERTQRRGKEITMLGRAGDLYLLFSRQQQRIHNEAVKESGGPTGHPALGSQMSEIISIPFDRWVDFLKSGGKL